MIPAATVSASTAIRARASLRGGAIHLGDIERVDGLPSESADVGRSDRQFDLAQGAAERVKQACAVAGRTSTTAAVSLASRTSSTYGLDAAPLP